MSQSRSRALVAALLLLGSVVAGTAGATAQAPNATDGEPGALVASGVETQGGSVGAPLSADGDGFYRTVSTVMAAYSDEQPTLGPGSELATGNVVNLHVTDGSEERVVSFRLTGDNRITDLRAGARADADLRMTTDRATLDRIAAAREPGAAFARALDSGAIRVAGRDLVGGAVWTAVDLLRDVGLF